MTDCVIDPARYTQSYFFHPRFGTSWRKEVSVPVRRAVIAGYMDVSAMARDKILRVGWEAPDPNLYGMLR